MQAQSVISRVNSQQTVVPNTSNIPHITVNRPPRYNRDFQPLLNPTSLPGNAQAHYPHAQQSYQQQPHRVHNYRQQHPRLYNPYTTSQACYNVTMRIGRRVTAHNPPNLPSSRQYVHSGQ